MLRYLSVFLVFVWSQSHAQDFSALQKDTFTKLEVGTLHYRILYPRDYDRTKKYPLVLFLHGAGERGDDNEKQLVHGVKHFLETDNRADFPCILVAPQCPSESYWGSVQVDRSTQPLSFVFDYQNNITTPLQLAVDLVKHLLTTESIDKKRVYITGLSMGGMGTLEAVYRYPKLFAAAAPVCGGADIQAFTKKQARIPFWIFHGDADAVVPVAFSRDLVAHLQSLGATVKYSEYPGVNHNSWENAYAEPELMSWLFAQRR